ncbi:hypothetical protein WEB32_11245 [Streptomyces netropsis]|uniref:hypothetical protein n=1 Tax=Streptomyces netropsis TaxID=55404 RepID=UPI0030D494F2
MLVGSGTLAGVTPVWAETAAPVVALADQPADQPSLITAAAAEEARDRVLKLAKSYLPAEIRVSAWNALRSSRGDAAIREWLAPGGGFQSAMQRMRTTQSRNKAFCERVLRTHTVDFSPAVRAAADRAVKGTDADRVAFVKSGYAEAQQQDRIAREAGAQHRQEVAAKDRDFVRTVSERDPGENVRVAAQWALRPGTTDADIAEFFGYGWVTGATLDLEGYRVRVADAEVLRHSTLSRLIEQAVAAEQALQKSADTAKARAEAERAWRTVADHADAARNAWLAEQATAMVQADSWKAIATAAKESTGELWKNITAPAEANQGSWAKEQSEAAETAGFWKDMFDRAQDSQKRVKG